MELVEREIGGGVVEQRFYNDDGKLEDIRKVYPPQKISAPNRLSRVRLPGAASPEGD